MSPAAAPIPRVRMFAGPNGSGKSTLFRGILPESLRGVYLNPDEIEQVIRRTLLFNPANYGVTASAEEILGFFRASSFLRSRGLESELARLNPGPDGLAFPDGPANAYFASVASDFLRHRLLAGGQSFTFETVMSSPDKIQFLRKAQEAGFRTYLYYVATDDPIINQSRVQTRVKLGGHAVPEDKIATRYHRSLALLPDAIRATHRAYVFDNSGSEGTHTWLAEITDGKELELKTDLIPAWFKRTLDQMVKS